MGDTITYNAKAVVVLTFILTVLPEYCILKYLYFRTFWDGFDEGDYLGGDF